MELVFGKSQERFESELIVNQAITNKQVVNSLIFVRFYTIIWMNFWEIVFK